MVKNLKLLGKEAYKRNVVEDVAQTTLLAAEIFPSSEGIVICVFFTGVVSHGGVLGKMWLENFTYTRSRKKKSFSINEDGVKEVNDLVFLIIYAAFAK